MKEFMFIIRGGSDQMPDKSPEAMQKHMADWNVWMGALSERGLLVGGEPLEEPGRTFIEGGTKVIDRPLAEGKELVGGYIIVKADDMDGACALVDGCPAFDHHCSMEVRQIMQMQQ
ncbi:MAG: hypothetical protein JXR07_06380 [Reichenbachiella sp.]